VLAAAELGHEPVAVAAVDRADELGDLPVRGAARALELEGGRVERHAERRRLLLVRHRRLDRLDAARELDAVRLGEQLVEGAGVEIRRRQAGDERLRDVQRLDRHRHVVGEPEPRRDHDRLRRGDVQRTAEVRAGHDRRHRLRLAAGPHPASAHVLAERRHRQLLRDLRLAHEGSRAALSQQEALADEVVERGAHRQARDAEVERQLPLRRDRAADAQLVDQIDDALAGLALLRDALCLGHAGRMLPARTEVVNTTPLSARPSGTTLAAA
jgi:hypothetical protein